jgi:hypothetical protein
MCLAYCLEHILNEYLVVFNFLIVAYHKLFEIILRDNSDLKETRKIKFIKYCEC